LNFILGRQLEQTDWDDLIGSIYETTISPQQLPGVMTRIDTLLNSDACHLFSIEGGRPGGLSITTNNWINHKDLIRYYEHYHRIDPRRTYAENQPVGKVMQCSTVYDERYVNRNEFYQDFLIPTGARYIAGACLFADNNTRIHAAFNHFSDRGVFTDDEMKRLQRLTPHLVRAAHMMVANRDLTHALAANEIALTSLRQGLIALDAKNSIVYANDAAEQQFMPEWKELFQGSSVREHSSLATRIKEARHNRIVQCMLQHSRHLGDDAVLSIIPLKNGDGLAFMGDRAPLSGNQIDALILIAPARNRQAASARLLMSLFGLSRAEARLAHGLASGQSPEDYAQAACVSINTIRTQIRALLEKTGERRLPDLIRMLSLLPSFRDLQ